MAKLIVLIVNIIKRNKFQEENQEQIKNKNKNKVNNSFFIYLFLKIYKHVNDTGPRGIQKFVSRQDGGQIPESRLAKYMVNRIQTRSNEKDR